MKFSSSSRSELLAPVEGKHGQGLSTMAEGHDARVVADTLVHLGLEKGRPRDPLQIIKLTYLCHGWMLGLYHRPLSIQFVKAWKYGPVIPDVYHKLKQYGSRPVQTDSDSMYGGFDDLEEDLVEQVSDLYNEFSGIQLSQMTHAVGTPWHITWKQKGQNATIPNDLIEKHFAELAHGNGQ